MAVNEALKDAKAGRIDFAIVGGVNLFGDEQLFHHLRRASMLSPSGRCHTFSAEADGYVRAEGGVLFLLARETLELPSHGRILGSAVTQNSRMGLACFKNGNSTLVDLPEMKGIIIFMENQMMINENHRMG